MYAADHAFFNIHKELHNPFGKRALDIVRHSLLSFAPSLVC